MIPALGSISIIRGQALFIDVVAPDDVDLTQATIEFGIAQAAVKPYIVTLPTTVSGQTITADLDETETVLLSRPEYYYSCWVIVAGDPTPVARGILKVESDSRNR